MKLRDRIGEKSNHRHCAECPPSGPAKGLAIVDGFGLRQGIETMEIPLAISSQIFSFFFAPWFATRGERLSRQLDRCLDVGGIRSGTKEQGTPGEGLNILQVLPLGRNVGRQINFPYFHYFTLGLARTDVLTSLLLLCQANAR